MSVETVTKIIRKRGVRNVPLSECAYCHEVAAREVVLPQVYGSGEELIIIEKVPSMLCDSCGQCYINDATMKKVDEVLSNPDKHTKNKIIRVATSD
jgi:YgiT-type zinc finger domain-containing protein